MKIPVWALLVLILPAFCSAQTKTQDIPASQLQAVLDLPLGQAVKQREVYKLPLKAAYNRQIAMVDKDCLTESDQGQQPYNICMGQASEQADKDFAVFYNSLQMLCHDQSELAALQAFEKEWQTYKQSGIKATRASWPDGTAASGVTSGVYLSLVRDHILLLSKIYDLNISQ